MISTLAVLKKKMVEKPWLYEEEEHVVLKLAEDAVEFIRRQGGYGAEVWLEEHK
jgi:hypothetical protein